MRIILIQQIVSMLTKLTPLLLVLALSACQQQEQPQSTKTQNTAIGAVSRAAVVEHYADMAFAVYGDCLTSMLVLRDAVETLTQNPSADNLQGAKNAWLEARQVYGQSEAFRFGNPIIDAWEGQVNAWPLDEGLIDYVDTSNYDFAQGNAFGQHNIIAGDETIDDALLRSYHEKGGSEANVASGYHAIEFLLWGQDLNPQPNSSGMRPWTDYANDDACTGGHCARRAQYLSAATKLLITNLKYMVAEWSPEKSDNYRASLLQEEPDEGLRRIVFGIGSLSLGELSGERMKVALLAHSQEDEHSCFSDNTHNDIDRNIQGIANVYRGSYSRLNGASFSGPSLHQLLTAANPQLAQSLDDSLKATTAKSKTLVDTASNGEHFDQLIVSGNTAGNALVKAVIESLRSQTELIEDLSRALALPNV